MFANKDNQGQGPLIQILNQGNKTGGIEKLSAKVNFSKILKVNHFYLGFSSNKKS